LAQDIERTILEIIGKHCLPNSTNALSLSTRLDSAGLDSLGMAEAIFELEDAFGIEIPESESAAIGQFETIQDIRDAIAAALDERG
jgi:acyl carrier protein